MLANLQQRSKHQANNLSTTLNSRFTAVIEIGLLLEGSAESPSLGIGVTLTINVYLALIIDQDWFLE